MIHDCISHDGKYLACSEEVFQCPLCLRTERHSAVRDYCWFPYDAPSCRCEQTGRKEEQGYYFTAMKSLGVRPPIGYSFQRADAAQQPSEGK